jgi:hypothetical protein
MMKRLMLVLVFGCFISSLNTSGASAAPLDAASLSKEIKLKGAKAVMAELTGDDAMTQFEKVCDKIETGTKEWLEVAKLLLPGSDAATTESLVTSVSRALPKAPRRVLELIAETEHDRVWTFRVNNTCISTFIEPEPGVVEEFLSKSEMALNSLNTSDNPRLEGLRLKCLRQIRGHLTYFHLPQPRH